MSTAPPQPYADFEELKRVFKDHVAPGKLAFYEKMGIPFVMGKRNGIWFHDAYSDRRFINCHCNGGVFNLGHRNPRVVAAITEALQVIDIGNHHFPSGHRARLAQRLAETTNGRLPRVVFGVSGGEAVDVALKVARGKTKRPKIISASGGYHGHTGLSLAAGDPAFREPFGPNLPGFEQVAFDDVAAMDRAIDDDTAAVILEPIPATLGMPIPSSGYLPEVRRLTADRGALLIVDEVQTGLGRTGRWWGYQNEGIEPDALITGKGLSGSVFPISATLLTRELHQVLDGDDPFVHISTFGGSEIGCVAANTVLDVVSEAGFLDRVTRVGQRIVEAFEPLPFEHRQRGLFGGLKFESPDHALGNFARLLMNGVFTFPAGNDRSVLQFLPPLIMTDEETGELTDRVTKALG